jgi:hypothetical protein
MVAQPKALLWDKFYDGRRQEQPDTNKRQNDVGE